MNELHEAAAQSLRDAYAAGPIPPLRAWLEPTDASGAYAVQAINTRYWEAQGRRIVGRKAGLTAVAVQRQLGVDQPDFGVLFDDMQVADGGRLDAARCLQAKAEGKSPSYSSRNSTQPIFRLPTSLPQSRRSMPRSRS